MNERIKLLAEQAEIKFESHPQHQGIDTAVIIPTDLEKFAELIVRECAKVADSITPPIVSDLILEHFGVEE
jgi:hypothetical protein